MNVVKLFLRRKIRHGSWHFPRIYTRYYGAKWDGAMLPENYKVYVGGFPRSGNNFVLELCRELLGDREAVSPASHYPPFIASANQRDTPTLLTVREPIASAASWIVAKNWPPAEVIRYYIGFHEYLLSHGEGIQVVDFEKTSNLTLNFLRALVGAIGVRDKSDAELDPETIRASVFRAIEEMSEKGSRILPIPSNDRVEMKTRARERLQDPTLKRLLDEATVIHQQVLQKFPAVGSQPPGSLPNSTSS